MLIYKVLRILRKVSWKMILSKTRISCRDKQLILYYIPLIQNPIPWTTVKYQNTMYFWKYQLKRQQYLWIIYNESNSKQVLAAMLIREIKKYQWHIQGKGKSTITDHLRRTARTRQKPNSRTVQNSDPHTVLHCSDGSSSGAEMSLRGVWG